MPRKPQDPPSDLSDDTDPLREELQEARSQLEILKIEEQADRIREARRAAAEQRAEQAAQRQHNDKLKEFGRDVASKSGLPAEWRARLTEELGKYVSAERFPVSLPIGEAQEYVRVKVLSMVEEYREAVKRDNLKSIERITQEIKQRQRDEELAAQEAKVKELIEEGMRWAVLETIRWDQAEREDVRQDVHDALRDNVRPDWTGPRVRRLVEEVLDDWEEADDEDGADPNDGGEEEAEWEEDE